MREYEVRKDPSEDWDRENLERFLCGGDAVVGVRVHKSDIEVVRRKHVEDEPFDREPPPRGKVTEFSYKSRQRLAFTAANSLVTFQSMLTLTYPADFPSDGKTVKSHLNTFLQALRRRTKQPYLWFLEFQRRGAPHFHILSAYRLPSPRNVVKRSNGASWETFKPDDDWAAQRWYEIVGSGDLNHWRCGTSWEAIRSKDGGARYAVKYAYKLEQKSVPEDYSNVGRMWGHSRDVKPPERPLTKLPVSTILELCRDGDKPPEAFKYVFGGAQRYHALLDDQGAGSVRREDETHQTGSAADHKSTVETDLKGPEGEGPDRTSD